MQPVCCHLIPHYAELCSPLSSPFQPCHQQAPPLALPLHLVASPLSLIPELKASLLSKLFLIALEILSLFVLFNIFLFWNKNAEMERKLD